MSEAQRLAARRRTFFKQCLVSDAPNRTQPEKPPKPSEEHGNPATCQVRDNDSNAKRCRSLRTPPEPVPVCGGEPSFRLRIKSQAESRLTAASRPTGDQRSASTTNGWLTVRVVL